jgi:hypothetical protein
VRPTFLEERQRNRQHPTHHHHHHPRPSSPQRAAFSHVHCPSLTQGKVHSPSPEGPGRPQGTAWGWRPVAGWSGQNESHLWSPLANMVALTDSGAAPLRWLRAPALDLVRHHCTTTLAHSLVVGLASRDRHRAEKRLLEALSASHATRVGWSVGGFGFTLWLFWGCFSATHTTSQ